MRCIEQRHLLTSAELAKLPNARVAGQFSLVPAAELVESRGEVVEPKPQFCAWRNVLHPSIEMGIRLFDAARPQPVHENSGAVRRLERVVNAFDLEGHLNRDKRTCT